MNKVMKFIKKNSSAVVGISVFILVIVAILLIKNIFMFDDTKVIYGTRLEGIEKVKISSNQRSSAESKISGDVESVKVRIAGKIVNTTIKTKAETSIDDAKKLAEEVLGEFKDNQKKFYDFQFFIDNESNTEQFPIIGYKHRSIDSITWTKDRSGN